MHSGRLRSSLPHILISSWLAIVSQLLPVRESVIARLSSPFRKLVGLESADCACR